jgi:hypothetical protein
VAGSARASSNHDEFLLGIGRQGTQGFLSPMFKNQCNRLTKVRQTFFTRLALTIRSGHFGAVRDIPWTILFNYRSELVAHVYILPLAQILTKVSTTGI